MSALVSIIMPTYNRGHFIKQSIQSVLGQTYSNFELIIVDDGSTDDTASIIKSFDDPRIHYVYQSNAGVSAARNRGIKTATGRYIAFIDDDDLFRKTKLEDQVTYLQTHSQMGMVHTSCEIIDEAGHPTEIVVSLGTGNLYQALFRIHRILPSTVMIPKSVLDTVGGFDETLTLAEDLDLWLRIARNYPIGEIQNPLTQVRKHDSNTAMDAQKMLAAFLKITTENRAASPEMGSLFWRKLIGYYYHYCGNHLLNTQPHRIGLAWQWFFPGLIQWPLSRQCGLLGLRLIFRTLIPPSLQTTLRDTIRRVIGRTS